MINIHTDGDLLTEAYQPESQQRGVETEEGFVTLCQITFLCGDWMVEPDQESDLREPEISCSLLSGINKRCKINYLMQLAILRLSGRIFGKPEGLTIQGIFFPDLPSYNYDSNRVLKRAFTYRTNIQILTRLLSLAGL